MRLLDSKHMNWFIPLFAVLLYINTLGHGFVLDDGIVITENEFTQKGLTGIWDILTTDSFRGFFKESDKQNLVSGGRYRPLSVVTYAIEYQLFGKNAFIGHLLTLLWYALLCFVLFRTFLLLLQSVEHGSIIAAVAALIFTAHPIHTEVVSNIKGRDEIFALLFSLLALYFALKWVDAKLKRSLILAVLMLFLGLMSKENAITFLGVIPLAIWLFRENSFGRALSTTIFLLAPAIVFILIRQSILGNSLGEESTELMNNPFLKYVDGKYVAFTGAEKLATILYTWLLYIKLLFAPIALTHDYYPRHIDIMTFGNIGVLLSFALHVFLVVFAILNLKKSKILAFSMLFYLMTFIIVSNLFFPIGTNMAERFMFMPSVGFALAIGYFFSKLHLKYSTVLVSFLGLILILFSVKTFIRNQAWKDNYTLFSTDIQVSPNSAKLLNALGGATLDEVKEEKDEFKKNQRIEEAISYLKKSLEIHPVFEGSELLLGNAMLFKKDYEGAISQYRKLIANYEDDRNAKNNLAIALRDYGKYAGETQNDIDKAMGLLTEAYTLDPKDIETIRLLAVANGVKGNHNKSIEMFLNLLKQDDKNPNVYLNLGKAYGYIGDEANKKLYIDKALQLDPNILNGL